MGGGGIRSSDTLGIIHTVGNRKFNAGEKNHHELNP